MEVILLKDIENVGKAGSTLKVKDGYARNYLFPHNLAVVSSSGNIKNLEQKKQQMDLQREKIKKAAESLKTKIEALSLTIPVLTKEKDKMYGSITVVELVKALKDENIEIDKNCVQLEEPIKTVGIYEIPAQIHPEVTAKIKVWVVEK
ncbi:MAG: 50S ribosomal protein L9 [Candidatus Omnitrophica bacterium]|nr:50S ribosomal protein L9 [Candidatus Omnitrophota bacterium]